VDGLASTLEVAFYMTSALSTNTTSGIGWYVDSEDSQHMTYNHKFFRELHEKEMGVQVVMGDILPIQ
jgi:hypothetical protein